MLIDRSGEAWPFVERAVQEFGDVIAMDTRGKGLYIVNAVILDCSLSNYVMRQYFN